MRHGFNFIATSGVSTFYCPRCEFEVVVPKAMTASAQSNVAEQVRQRKKMEAIQTVREYQPDLTQAKAITNHVTRSGGRCVRCAHVSARQVSIAARSAGH